MIYLASASPRRAELLRQIEVAYELLAVDIDESVLSGETPEVYVQRVTRQKAAVAWNDHRRTRPWPVLSADTSVVSEGIILGKPQTEAEALAMYRALSGSTHEVMTAICLQRGTRVRCELCVSEVRFRALSEAEMRHYWRSGEGRDKAGGYAVQGYAARFIEHLSGSYSAVMGLPLHLVDQLLSEREFFA